jgi:hypothetical protein
VQNRYSIQLQEPNLGPRERLALFACVLNMEFDFFSYLLDYLPAIPLTSLMALSSIFSEGVNVKK